MTEPSRRIPNAGADDENPRMSAWSRLLDILRSRSAIWYLVIAIVVAVVAGAGLAAYWLVQPPATPTALPTPTEEMPTVSSPRATETPRLEWRLTLPFVSRSGGTPFALAGPSPTPEPGPPTPTPTPPPTDFGAVREELRAEGKDLAHVKIGFHLGPGGTARGLGEYLDGLAQAGVPAVIKSADAYGVCAEALQASPDNVTVFRISGGSLELPDYDLPPEVAAEEHWARVLEALPPEFDRRTWIEVMNEPDKNRADWLGRFARRTGELALRDGYRLAAFGWSSGEPEPEDWRTPGMRAYLTLAAQNPERISVALHEYSFDVDNIARQYPSLVGRFQLLFRACDEMGISRPTVLITEWGWEHESVPDVSRAMKDIGWASELYGAYPEVRGAAIWYLGSGYGGIAGDAQRLIKPLWWYAWSEYFVIEPGQKPTDPNQFAP